MNFQTWKQEYFNQDRHSTYESTTQHGAEPFLLLGAREYCAFLEMSDRAVSRRFNC
jgi:hypothetical protein